MKTPPRWVRASVFFLSFVVAARFCAAAELFLRVVDIGQGECVVAKVTDKDGPRYFLYDTGVGGPSTLTGIKDVIPPGAVIDLMVISHNDGDHIGGLVAVMDAYKVKRIIHPGDNRPGKEFPYTRKAILEEPNCDNIDLSKRPIAPGTPFPVGGMTAIFVSGYSRPPASWGKLDDSEENNAGSVIVRLLFNGRSILLCGDAVGRHLDSPANTCIASELEVVSRLSTVPVDSDVIVAPHHGANNGSSERFIKAVSPEYVIFAAGHSTRYQHPNRFAVGRYLSAGVKVRNIFRTDRGDDDGPNEWEVGRIEGNKDPSGDDDVEVTISASDVLSVRYGPSRL